MSNLFIYQLLETADSFREIVLEQQSVQVQNTVDELTTRQQRLLRLIYNYMTDQPDGVSLKTLADAQKLSSSAVSVMVDNLVQRNILERRTSPMDRRKVLIRIGETGWKTILQLRQIYDDLAQNFLAGMSEEKKTIFNEEIQRLQQYSSKMREGKK